MIARTVTLAPCLAPPTVVDFELSQRIARKERMRNGKCWFNAMRAWEYTLPDATYVEGYVVVDDDCPQPIPHAWLELPDGRVVDPTPIFTDPSGPRAVYFPAFRYAPDFLRYIVATYSRVILPYSGIGNDDFSGWDHPDWQVAMVAAWRHAAAWHLGRSGVSLLHCDEATTLDALDIRSLAAGHFHSPRRHPRLLTTIGQRAARSAHRFLTGLTSTEAQPD